MAGGASLYYARRARVNDRAIPLNRPANAQDRIQRMVPFKAHLIAAARPNFMKIAPLYHELAAQTWCRPAIVHTGQHYDANMFDAFFRDLRLPKPHFNLEVGSGSHAEQTGGVMIAYEKVAMTEKPNCMIVVGDVNSTAACAMVGAKLRIPVIHLEAGLRSGDRRMPEEINRLVTDAISDVLWTPSPDANENLIKEGIAQDKIDFVGNIMIDSYEMLRQAISVDDTSARFGLTGRRYAVVTLHRPSNVDDRDVLGRLVTQLIAAAQEIDLVFAVHPRTRKRLDEFGLLDSLTRCRRIELTEPLSYIRFMNVVVSAAAVVTDSGGVQEESTYLGIPCLTLRENTERPITITEGTNRLVATDDLLTALRDAMSGRWDTGKRPAKWDGRTAARCEAALRLRFG
jgi:UDP-N-acetylglucosamine 2-epimerase (non-hydrolysing)